MNWYPEGSKYDTPYAVGEGLGHIAFCVDEIKETFRELVAKGVAATDFGPERGASYCYRQKVSSSRTDPVPGGSTTPTGELEVDVLTFPAWPTSS